MKKSLNSGTNTLNLKNNDILFSESLNDLYLVSNVCGNILLLQLDEGLEIEASNYDLLEFGKLEKIGEL